MQNDSYENTEELNNSVNSSDRRRRIKRMKTVIVVIAVFFLVLPTVICTILAIQYIQLQNQVEELVLLHVQDGYTLEGSKNLNLAYANIVEPDLSEATQTDKVPSQDTLIGESLSPTPGNIASQEPNYVSPVPMNETNTSSENTISPTPANTESPTPSNTESPTPTDTVSPTPGVSISPTPGQKIGAGLDPNEEQGESIRTVNGHALYTGNDQGIYTGKKVYLTFDDGPSIHTDEILDILAEYNVKATFFVVGKTDDTSLAQYKRIVQEGHTLGMHSYSHKYDLIYNSVEDFDKDFTKLWKLLYDTTGYKPTIYRFPGGSDNGVNKNGMEDFIRYLGDKNIVYYDWNVLNGDATGVSYTVDQLIDNIIKDVAVKKRSIVLMHDVRGKKSTVESLPELLEQLITGGAELLALDEKVTPIQMIKADSVK